VPAAEVLVAGKDGSAAADLRARLRADPQLAGSVRLLGHRTDVDDLLCAADVLVVASHVEGTAGAALEAMASGTPVVTSNVSSLPEVVGDAALMVDPYDIEAIADAMARVLGNPELHASLRARGLARARHFSWERSVRRVREIYGEVLARR
jgi:glycosyltransferase involved in cell wall biosynthesis